MSSKQDRLLKPRSIAAIQPLINKAIQAWHHPTKRGVVVFEVASNGPLIEFMKGVTAVNGNDVEIGTDNMAVDEIATALNLRGLTIQTVRNNSITNPVSTETATAESLNSAIKAATPVVADQDFKSVAAGVSEVAESIVKGVKDALASDKA